MVPVLRPVVRKDGAAARLGTGLVEELGLPPFGRRGVAAQVPDVFPQVAGPHDTATGAALVVHPVAHLDDDALGFGVGGLGRGARPLGERHGGTPRETDAELTDGTRAGLAAAAFQLEIQVVFDERGV